MPNSFNAQPLNSPPTQVIPGYQRYPITMHRGVWPNIESRLAKDADEEQASLAAGWGTKRPPIPEPDPPKLVVTLEDRVAGLEAAALGQSILNEAAAETMTLLMEEVQALTAALKKQRKQKEGE